MTVALDLRADRYIKSLNPSLYLPLWKKDTGKTFDTCLSFDGTDDYALSALSFDWNTNNWTVNIWASLNNVADAYMGIVGVRYGAGGGNWWTLGTTSTGKLTIEVTGGGNTEINYKPANQGVQYYTIARSGNTLTIYRNAVSVGTIDITGINIGGTTNTLILGQWYTSLQRWAGTMDSLTAYSRTLSAAEIAVNFSRGRTNKPQPYSTTGLVAWYQMDEATGTSLADASGNGNTGTITGATWVDASTLGIQSEDAYGHYCRVSHAGMWTPQGYKFNGTSNGIILTVPQVRTDKLTVLAWIKAGAIDTTRRDIISSGAGDAYATNNWILSMNNTVNGSLGVYGSAAFLNTDAQVVSLGKWDLVGFISDGTNTSILVNDRVVLSGALAMANTNATGEFIGKRSDASQFFKDAIGECVVIPRALSPLEIQSLYQLTKHRYQ